MADTLPYHTDAETSRNAAKAKERNGSAMTDRRKFYDLIRAANLTGVTDEEAHAHFGMSHGPRFRELAQASLIVRTHRTRGTSSGATSFVWVATCNLPTEPALLRWTMTGKSSLVEFDASLWSTRG